VYHKYIGKSVTRVDLTSKLTGHATYGYDFSVPHMLHGKVKRSPHPHAKILKIDTTAASSLPGVRAVITANDVPNSLYGVMLKDTPMLARDRVRYVGEAVAAVAADTVEIAEEAIDLIKVEYQQLPFVTDAEEAAKSTAVVIHPELSSYKAGPPFPVRTDPSRPNVGNHYHVDHGDVEEAFKKADFIIENRFTTAAMQHMHLELSAAVAKVEHDGRVTIWSATQSPHMIRQQVSDILKIPHSRIRVIAPYEGGGFGSRLEVHTEPISVALAMKSGKPVRVALTREEVFTSTLVRHPYIITMKDGVQRDGKIIARDMKVILNGGAYSGGFGMSVCRNCIFGAVSTYNIPNFRFDSIRVFTNSPSGGAFRGYGSTQVDWAIECQMDCIATQLHLDRIQLRKLNLLHAGDKNAIGETMKNVNHDGVTERVLDNLKLGSKPESGSVWKRGKGFALTTKYTTAPTASAATLRILDDNTALLFISAVEIGTGSDTIFSQIVAEELDCPMESVIVSGPDTQFTPFDDGANSSRRTYYMGNAVKMAAVDAKNQILQRASKVLNVPVTELVLENWKVHEQSGSKSITLPELFVKDQTRSGAFLPGTGDLIGRGVWHEKVGFLDPATGRSTSDRVVTYYTPVATGVEVEVNVETGQIKFLSVYCAVDVGKALNPLNVEGQIEGGVVQGLGGATFEEVILAEGKPINTNLADYKVPLSLGTPYVKAFVLETPEQNGPFGARGVGEGPITGIAPALANAVADAVGARVFDLPLIPEKILASIQTKGGSR
jgi:CO/xanthine dehydrogenase Mo-binding subunit